jgi:hypothetical protein
VTRVALARCVIPVTDRVRSNASHRDVLGAEPVARLGALGVPVALGPVGRRGERGEGTSPCCRDLGGSLLELIACP